MPVDTPPVYYREYLRRELLARKERNGRYSTRAFSRFLRVDPGTISRILRGVQLPTPKMADRLLEKLGLSKEDEKRFRDSLVRALNSKQVGPISGALKGRPPHTPAKRIDNEIYQSIVAWHHPAILELTFVENFSSEPSWIASALRISEVEARAAIDRLLALGLLVWEDGVLKKASVRFTTRNKSKTSEALREHQKELLKQAICSLEKDPVERRSTTSMVMAINPKRIPLAKRMISRFNSRLCRILETGPRTLVYNLEVALYPLQQEKNEPR